MGNGGTLIAKDSGKAFDRTDPEVATRALSAKGLPAHWARLLRTVWLGQHRCVELAAQTQGVWQAVSSSLPQGDPFSQVGLTAILAAPTKDVANLLDDRGKQVLFVGHCGRTAGPCTSSSFKAPLAERS